MEQLKDQVLTQLFAGKKTHSSVHRVIACIPSVLGSQNASSAAVAGSQDMKVLLQCCSMYLLAGWLAAAKVQCGQ